MENTKKVPMLRFPEFSGKWEVKKLGDIFPYIRNGFVGIATPYYREKGVPYLQGKNIKNGCIKNDGLIYISKEFHEKSIKSQLKLNDVVMVQSGHVGECALITEDYVNNNCHAILVMTPIKNIYSKFYVYFFYSVMGKKIIYTVKTGNTIEHILSSEMKTVKVSCPEKQEQQKIAHFLSEIDNRIEKITKKKQLLESYKKGVMKKIFNQEIRFKDDNGEGYPDWEEKELGDISDVRDGTHDSPKYHQNGFAFITSKNLLANGSIDFENVSLISQLDFNNFNKRSKVDIGDILFGMIGTIGNPVLIKTSGFAIKNVALIKEKKELKNIFLVHYLNSSLVLKQFDDVTVGNTQKFIALGKIRKLKINIPSLPEQTKIANFLTEIYDKINLVSKQLEGTKQYKQGLLQKMFV